MIKALFFDCWGTLVENGVQSPTKQVKHILNIKMPFPEYVTRMERAMMTQSFPTLRDAFLSICREFNLQCREQELEELIGMWNKSWMLAQPYDEVIELLTALKKKYTLILFSNTDSFSINSVLEKFSLRQFFDRVALSYRLGMIKTDKNFLNTLLTDLGLTPEECLIIGDSIHSDMLPAQRIGAKAILIDRKDRQEFMPKIKNLNELPLLLEENKL